MDVVKSRYNILMQCGCGSKSIQHIMQYGCGSKSIQHFNAVMMRADVDVIAASPPS